MIVIIRTGKPLGLLMSVVFRWLAWGAGALLIAATPG